MYTHAYMNACRHTCMYINVYTHFIHTSLYIQIINDPKVSKTISAFRQHVHTCMHIHEYIHKFIHTYIYIQIINDPKVSKTISAFRQHVPRPTAADIQELQQVLNRYRQVCMHVCMYVYVPRGTAADIQELQQVLYRYRQVCMYTCMFVYVYMY